MNIQEHINFEPGRKLQDDFYMALEKGSDAERFRQIKNNAKNVLRSGNLEPEQESYILNIINVVNEVIISKKMEENPRPPIHKFYEISLEASRNVTAVQKSADPVTTFGKAIEESRKLFDEVIKTKASENERNLAKEVFDDLSYYGRLSLLPGDFHWIEAAPEVKHENLLLIHTQNVLHDQYSAVDTVPNAVFTEGRIFGDGECGFSATNTTRAEVIAHLYAHAEEESVRRAVAPEIVGWLKTTPVEELPDEAKPVMNDYWQANAEREDRPGVSGTFDKRINVLAEGKSIFLLYIQAYYVRGKDYLVLPDPGSTGVLNVIADMKGLQVRAWKIESSNKGKELYLHDVFGKEQDKEHTIDIIHRNIHFNKLLPTENEFKDFPKRVVGERVIFSPLRLVI